MHTPAEVEETGPVKLHLTSKDPSLTFLEVDVFLAATGFVPHTKGYGLEDVGVEIGKRGNVVVDGDFQTSVPGIYAAGDVRPAPRNAPAQSAMDATGVPVRKERRVSIRRLH